MLSGPALDNLLSMSRTSTSTSTSTPISSSSSGPADASSVNVDVDVDGVRNANAVKGSSIHGDRSSLSSSSSANTTTSNPSDDNHRFGPPPHIRHHNSRRRIFRHLFHVVDWFPTLAEWVGVVPLNQTSLDGISQVDALSGNDGDNDDGFGLPARTELFGGYAQCEDNYPKSYSWWGPAIRHLNWKLVQGESAGPDAHTRWRQVVRPPYNRPVILITQRRRTAAATIYYLIWRKIRGKKTILANCIQIYCKR